MSCVRYCVQCAYLQDLHLQENLTSPLNSTHSSFHISTLKMQGEAKNCINVCSSMLPVQLCALCAQGLHEQLTVQHVYDTHPDYHA